MIREPTQQWRCPECTKSITIDRFARQQLGEISWSRTRKLIASGKVSINGIAVCDMMTPVRAGDLVEYNPNAWNEKKPQRLTIPLIYVDSQIVVVNKPAGISTVPFNERDRGTLLELVRQSLCRPNQGRAPCVHVVHRIDKETSGIVVFARTRTALKRMKQMFRIHDIDRRYIALVNGCPSDQTFSSRLVINRGDGKRGSTSNPRMGRYAITHVRVLESLGLATLVQCRLETGRTHQIRIHLAEAGYPLLGERVYAQATKDFVPGPRLMLHTAHLAFQHPVTGVVQEYSLDMPKDMSTVLQTLRAASIRKNE